MGNQCSRAGAGGVVPTGKYAKDGNAPATLLTDTAGTTGASNGKDASKGNGNTNGTPGGAAANGLEVADKKRGNDESDSDDDEADDILDELTMNQQMAKVARQNPRGSVSAESYTIDT